jgi:WD40 repeat protein
MQGGMGYSVTKSAGHSNRIFAAKFVPSDENLIISGGWDNTVQVWDIRLGAAVRSIYGAHICGDALDIFGNEVLTGSWRPDNQLEIWDFGTGEKITDVKWNSSMFSSSGQPSCMLYSAQFSKEGHARYIIAGGSGSNEAKVFDHRNNNQIIGTITGLSRGVFAADFSPDNHKVAIAGGDASIRILEIGG